MTAPRKYSLEWLGDRAAAAAAIMAICSATFGVVWTFARNEIVDWISHLTGVPELTQEVKIRGETTKAAVDRLTVIVESTAEAIQRLHPPEIAEYDELLSRIFSPCNIGLECEAQLRVRRTPFGLECALPKVVGRFVTDKHGVEHPVQPPTRTAPTRLDGEWSLRPIIFTVPNRVPEGIATFHLLLEYDCGDRGMFMQESPHLPFEAIP